MNKLTQKEVIERLEKLGWKLIGEYKNTSTKTVVECPLCKKHFETIIISITSGNCRSCGCLKSKVCSEKQYSGGKYITGTEFKSIRLGAKRRRNLEFNITIKDIEDVYEKQNHRCKFTNEILVFDTTERNGDQSKIGAARVIRGTASVDRINSKKGYTPDNIQIIHKDINIAKQDKLDEDFIEMCCKIADFSRGKIESN